MAGKDVKGIDVWLIVETKKGDIVKISGLLQEAEVAVVECPEQGFLDHQCLRQESGVIFILSEISLEELNLDVEPVVFEKEPFVLEKVPEIHMPEICLIPIDRRERSPLPGYKCCKAPNPPRRVIPHRRMTRRHENYSAK